MNRDLQIAKKTIQTEIKGLKKLLSSLNNSSQFSKAVNLISKAKGKVIVIGTGKSFIIGNKISSLDMTIPVGLWGFVINSIFGKAPCDIHRSYAFLRGTSVKFNLVEFGSNIWHGINVKFERTVISLSKAG